MSKYKESIFTEAEDQKLRELFPIMPSKDLVEHFDKTVTQLTSRAHYLGLKKERTKKQAIIKALKADPGLLKRYSMEQLASKFCCSVPFIYKLMREIYKKDITKDITVNQLKKILLYKQSGMNLQKISKKMKMDYQKVMDVLYRQLHNLQELL